MLVLLTTVLVKSINGEDPYRFFTWNVTYGDIYPLGVKQQVLLLLLFSILLFDMHYKSVYSLSSSIRYYVFGVDYLMMMIKQTDLTVKLVACGRGY